METQNKEGNDLVDKSNLLMKKVEELENRERLFDLR
jgi:hypothetical protein